MRGSGSGPGDRRRRPDAHPVDPHEGAGRIAADDEARPGMERPRPASMSAAGPIATMTGRFVRAAGDTVVPLSPAPIWLTQPFPAMQAIAIGIGDDEGALAVLLWLQILRDPCSGSGTSRRQRCCIADEQVQYVGGRLPAGAAVRRPMAEAVSRP